MTRHFDSDSALWHALDLMSSRLFAIALSDNFEEMDWSVSANQRALPKHLFRFDNAKDIKKIPTQPGWIELGMILGKWEWLWECGLLFKQLHQLVGHYNLLLELGLRLVLIVMPQRYLLGRECYVIRNFAYAFIIACRRYSIHSPVLHDVAELAYVRGVSMTFGKHLIHGIPLAFLGKYAVTVLIGSLQQGQNSFLYLLFRSMKAGPLLRLFAQPTDTPSLTRWQPKHPEKANFPCVF